MQIWIVEDEQVAAERLCELLSVLRPHAKIRTGLDTVRRVVAALKEEAHPDLIFLDIHLADGDAFEIFESVQPACPVVFATAYDHYAIKAFKVNGLDYLLKPVERDELERVLNKFDELAVSFPRAETLARILAHLQPQRYLKRMLVRIRDELHYIAIEDIAYFFFDEGYVSLVTLEGEVYLTDSSLEALEKRLNPEHFFRINRKIILSASAIGKISRWFNGRLKVVLSPSVLAEAIVSRERVKGFKKWLEG